MSISSVKGGSINPFGALSKLGAGPQGADAKGKIDSLISDIGEKLKAGDMQGVAEGFKKLLETMGVKNADKILEALGLKQPGGEAGGAPAAGGGAPAGGAEGAGGGGAPEGAGGAGGAGGAPQAAGGAGGGAGGLLELLMKLAQENPELAKKLLENPELLKQLAENPELLQQLAQNPEQLQQVVDGAQAGRPMEFAGVSQFQAAAPPAPVSLG